jgi:uncharacterized protein (TIRG00374 family)
MKNLTLECMPKKKIFFLLKLAVAAGLVALLVEKVDWTRVGSELRTIAWPLLFLYILLQLLGILISAKKWRVIAAFKGLRFGLKDGFFTYLTGSFINNFLPSTIGGDAYRGIWLARKTEARAASLSTIVFDRFIGLWVTAILALVLLSAYFFENPTWPTSLRISFFLLVVFLLVDGLLTWAYREPRLSGFIERLPFPIRRLLDEVAGYVEKRIWTKASLYAALFAFVGVGLTNLTLFLSLGGSAIDPLAFFSVIFLATIISSIPISIGNIGIKEWAYFTFFPLAGISGDTAVTVALLSRFIQMFISFGALPYYLRERKGRK